MISRLQAFSVLENFTHPVDDATYFDMVTKNSREEVSKTVSVGQVFEVNSATALSDNMIIVSGPYSPSISVKMNKEKDFLKSITMTQELFLGSITNNNSYHVKIVSTDSGLRGSFYEAYKDVLRREFFDQLKNPTKVYDAKVIEKNRGGYFVNIYGVQAFLPGSLASANKIINFEAFLGKTVKVMLDSYISESDTFIVSNKRYIEHIMPEMIESIDMSVVHEGTVTGTIQSGIFVEFNEIMTGLLSQADMDESTLALFKNGQVRPGDKISVWVRDVVLPKNFILTQNSTEPMISLLTELSDILEKENADIVIAAKIVAIKGPNVTVEFNTSNNPSSSIMSTVLFRGSGNNRLRIGSNVKLRISSIEPKRNKLTATILTENESKD
jgi:ribosomal protein S1